MLDQNTFIHGDGTKTEVHTTVKTYKIEIDQIPSRSGLYSKKLDLCLHCLSLISVNVDKTIQILLNHKLEEDEKRKV